MLHSLAPNKEMEPYKETQKSDQLQIAEGRQPKHFENSISSIEEPMSYENTVDQLPIIQEENIPNFERQPTDN